MYLGGERRTKEHGWVEHTRNISGLQHAKPQLASCAWSLRLQHPVQVRLLIVRGEPCGQGIKDELCSLHSVRVLAQLGVGMP